MFQTQALNLAGGGSGDTVKNYNSLPRFPSKPVAVSMDFDEGSEVSATDPSVERSSKDITTIIPFIPMDSDLLTDDQRNMIRQACFLNDLFLTTTNSQTAAGCNNSYLQSDRLTSSKNVNVCLFMYAENCSNLIVNGICNRHWRHVCNTLAVPLHKTAYFTDDKMETVAVTDDSTQVTMASDLTKHHVSIFPMIGVLVRLCIDRKVSRSVVREYLRTFYIGRIPKYTESQAERLGLSLFNFIFFPQPEDPDAPDLLSVTQNRNIWITNMQSVMLGRPYTKLIEKFCMSKNMTYNSTNTIYNLSDTHVSIFEMPLWLKYNKGLVDTGTIETPSRHTAIMTVIPIIAETLQELSKAEHDQQVAELKLRDEIDFKQYDEIKKKKAGELTDADAKFMDRVEKRQKELTALKVANNNDGYARVKFKRPVIEHCMYLLLGPITQCPVFDSSTPLMPVSKAMLGRILSITARVTSNIPPSTYFLQNKNESTHIVVPISSNITKKRHVDEPIVWGGKRSKFV